VAHAGGGKDSEQGTHICEMNSGGGNGKPLLDSNCCHENPLLDLQESEETRRTTTNVYMLSDTTVGARVVLCGCVGNPAVCKQ